MSSFQRRSSTSATSYPVLWRIGETCCSPTSHRPRNASARPRSGGWPSDHGGRRRHRNPRLPQNRIQLSLINGSNYDVEKDDKYSITSFPKGEQVIEAQKPNEIRASKPSSELDTIPFRWSTKTRPSRSSAGLRPIELHQRLALPPACLLLALVGIPLGVSSRKGGKSGAFVVTVAWLFSTTWD